MGPSSQISGTASARGPQPPPWLRHWRLQGEPEVWHGGMGGLQGCGLRKAGLGRECPWQWWSGATQEDRESQAHSQTTLHPEAPREAAWSRRSGPCAVPASLLPPVAKARDPRCPQSPQLCSRRAGLGCGQLGREAEPGHSGAGATGTWAPTHTAATSHPAHPWGPQGSPTKGVTHTQTAPSPHWCSYHPGQPRAGPAEQQGAGPESGPGAPFIMAAPRSPHADTVASPGLPTVSNTRSGQEPHSVPQGQPGLPG